MARLTEEQLNGILRAVNRGISQAYFTPIADEGLFARKEVVEEAKRDLEDIVKKLNGAEKKSTVQRMQKYQEILDLLLNIPVEDLCRAIDLTHALKNFTINYFIDFPEIVAGNKAFMLPSKYQLISEKSKLEDRAAFRGNEDPSYNLIQLANKYLELLKI